MELVLPLKEMTVAEKLQLMEVLWDDLSAPRRTFLRPSGMRKSWRTGNVRSMKEKPSSCLLDENRQSLQKELQ